MSVLISFFTSNIKHQPIAHFGLAFESDEAPTFLSALKCLSELNGRVNTIVFLREMSVVVYK